MTLTPRPAVTVTSCGGYGWQFGGEMISDVQRRRKSSSGTSLQAHNTWVSGSLYRMHRGSDLHGNKSVAFISFEIPRAHYAYWFAEKWPPSTRTRTTMPIQARDTPYLHRPRSGALPLWSLTLLCSRLSAASFTTHLFPQFQARYLSQSTR
jgi:hypothetical protein